MEQAVQLAVATAKVGLAGASSDERDLFRDQLLQGTESIHGHHVSTWNSVFFRFRPSYVVHCVLELRHFQVQDHILPMISLCSNLEFTLSICFS